MGIDKTDIKPIKKRDVLLLAILLIFSIAITVLIYEDQNKASILFGVANQLEITIIEVPGVNRTIFADSEMWYCKITMFKAGDKVLPQDNVPNGDILFYFFEDIENKSMADNYGDLIIRLNLVVIDDELYCVVVFYGEGGYGKEVYYQGELMYVYDDDNPDSNYGIALVQISVEGSNLRFFS